MTEQSQGSEQEQEQSQEQEQEQNKAQESTHGGGSAQGQGATPANVFDFLRKSNIINMDVPLKTLFENIQTLQPDPSSSWGVVGDSGHLVIVWKG